MSNHGHHNHKMMWLMMIFCAVPLVIFLLAKGGTGGYDWLAIVAIGIFIVGHLWLMLKGHRGSSSEQSHKEHKDDCCR